MPATDLLAAVERSPRAAAAHDRAGWMALFTRDGRVEDPADRGRGILFAELAWRRTEITRFRYFPG
jgi:hypothetical protein